MQEFVTTNLLMNRKDPYGALDRLKQPSGLIKVEHRKICPGDIAFFTFTGNKYVVVDVTGKTKVEISKPTELTEKEFELYRPCKPYKDGFLATVLHPDDPKHKRSIAEVSMEGKVKWMTKPLWLSHDFDITQNEKIYTIIREDKKIEGSSRAKISNNVIVRLDKNGTIDWSWSLIDNLKQFSNGDQEQILIDQAKNNNPFHINSIQYVKNDFVHKLYGESIIVLSSRSMNKVFFVGVNSGKVLYELKEQTNGQHGARLIEQNLPGENHLLIFDNRNDHPNRTKLGNSRIIEVDVQTNKIVWSYENKPDDPIFFTPIVGSSQRLPNGNTLICEGYYGRIFEIDENGNIVWDYTYPETNYDASIDDQGPKEIFSAIKF